MMVKIIRPTGATTTLLRKVSSYTILYALHYLTLMVMVMVIRR